MDITCCVNEDCPLKQKCYRATAKWSENQSVQKFEYENNKGKITCDWFWDNKKYYKNKNIKT